MLKTKKHQSYPVLWITLVLSIPLFVGCASTPPASTDVQVTDQADFSGFESGISEEELHESDPFHDYY